MSTNYQFFNRSFDKVSEQGLSVENYSYNPSQDENQQPTYDFFIQYGDKQGSSNISVDSAELRVRNCDNMS